MSSALRDVNVADFYDLTKVLVCDKCGKIYWVEIVEKRDTNIRHTFGRDRHCEII